MQRYDNCWEKLRRTAKVICPDSDKNQYIYSSIFSLFANSLWDLSIHFKDDSQVMTALNKFIHAFQEMNKFHTILLDQASRTVLKNLTAFVKTYVVACFLAFVLIFMDFLAI